MAHYEDSPKNDSYVDDFYDPAEKSEVVGRLVDIFKRAISTGASVIFAPNEEEGKDKEKRKTLELPKELIQYVLNTAEGMQEAILRIIGNEIRKFLEHMDISEALQKILTSTSFEIKTEIRFIPNDQAVVSPSIRAKIRTKQNVPGKDPVVVEEEIIP